MAFKVLGGDGPRFSDVAFIPSLYLHTLPLMRQGPARVSRTLPISEVLPTFPISSEGSVGYLKS
jgi:hypothetical protein